jgi:heat shock protein HslJ
MRLLPLLLVAACGSSASGERWDEVQGAEWILWKIEGKPALEGAEISLTFATGRLYGEAVNRYGAGYSRAEDALTIEAVGATKKHIDRPAGAMDQEARYLKLLGQADGWSLGSGWLVLSEGGRQTLWFKRKESTSRD